LLGVGVGEHMGYLFTAAWTFTFAWVIRSGRPAAATVGALCGATIAAGLLEPAGISSVATVNAIGYTAWSLWLIWLGLLLIAGKPVLPTSGE
jgi:hypothetical protein